MDPFVRAARSLPQELGRVHHVLVVVVLEDAAVLRVLLFDHGHGPVHQPGRLDLVPVTAKPPRDEPVDVDPRRSAPHVLAVRAVLVRRDRGQRQRPAEGLRVPQVGDELRRLLGRRRAAEKRQEPGGGEHARALAGRRERVHVDTRLLVPEPIVDARAEGTVPLAEPGRLIGAAEPVGEGGEVLELVREQRVEVGRVELRRGVEARRVVRAALAAATPRVALDRPLDETRAVGIAVREVPVDVAHERLVDRREPLVVASGLVDERDREREHRRLRERAGLPAEGVGGNGDSPVGPLRVHDRGEHLPRERRVQVTPPDGVEAAVPEPDLPVRPPVGRRPAVPEQPLRRAHLRLHHAERLTQRGGAAGRPPRRPGPFATASGALPTAGIPVDPLLRRREPRAPIGPQPAGIGTEPRRVEGACRAHERPPAGLRYAKRLRHRPAVGTFDAARSFHEEMVRVGDDEP